MKLNSFNSQLYMYSWLAISLVDIIT